MNRLTALRAAIVERLGNIDDFTIYPRITDSANVPCAWVVPDKPLVDYQQVFRGAVGQWNFLIEIITNRIDIESAQDFLDEYIDPDGPFVTRLQDDTVQDALSELTSNSVQVLAASRYGSYRVGGTTYLGIQLSLQLWA